MNRRRFLAFGCIAIVAGSVAARGQQSKRMRHVGIMMPQSESDREARVRVDTLRNGLAAQGWVEGKTIRYSYRWRANSADRAGAAARELVDLAPDLIFANGTPATAALQKITTHIPIVFAVVVDPVGAGFVRSLARPGANITGFSTFEPEIGSKWLELLRELSPGLKHVGAIHDPTFRGFNGIWRKIEGTASAIGLRSTLLAFQKASDNIEAIVERFARQTGGGLVVLPTAINSAARLRIFAAAARHKLPAIYPFRHYAEDGGLMAYGFDPTDLVRRAATYVNRVLRGEEPTNLPVQAPNKFELVINGKTAKALGLSLPQTLLALADEVIE